MVKARQGTLFCRSAYDTDSLRLPCTNRNNVTYKWTIWALVMKALVMKTSLPYKHAKYRSNLWR